MFSRSPEAVLVLKSTASMCEFTKDSLHCMLIKILTVGGQGEEKEREEKNEGGKKKEKGGQKRKGISRVREERGRTRKEKGREKEGGGGRKKKKEG